MFLICSYFLRYLSLNVLISMVLTQQIACSFRSTTPMTCVSTPKDLITVRGLMQRVATQLGKQFLYIPIEPMRVLHGPLIHQTQPIMLCWSVHHSSLDRELSRPQGHCCSLPRHLPGHLVSSLISWEPSLLSETDTKIGIKLSQRRQGFPDQIRKQT